MSLRKRRIHLSAQDFIDEPGMFALVEELWRAKRWHDMFEEDPVGTVLATQEDGGITFYYMVREDDDDE